MRNPLTLGELFSKEALLTLKESNLIRHSQTSLNLSLQENPGSPEQEMSNCQEKQKNKFARCVKNTANFKLQMAEKQWVPLAY